MRFIPVLLCCTLAAACENGTKNTGGDLAMAVAKSPSAVAPTATPLDLSAAGSAKDDALDDGKILMILHVANQGEIEQAQLAQKRGTDKRALDFAKMMLKDHADADQKGDKLAQEQKLTLTESAVTAQLRSEGKQTMEKLQAVSAMDFDKAYIGAQVKGHQEVLALLRDKLRPAATNPKLQALIDAVTPTVQHHYDDAMKLQATAGKTAVPK